MQITAYLSEVMLADAFDALFDFVLAMPASGAQWEDAPMFTYLLTTKQMEQVNRVCAAKGWPLISCPGIEIDVRTIQHPVESRRYKDGVSDADIKKIIQKAYSPRSIIRENDHVEHDHQTLMFNTHQKIKIGPMAYHGMAVLEVRSDGARNYLAPVTCYHATEAKVRAVS